METSGRVAFLGLGIMGWPMAANLARAGFDLSVWTRDPAKAGRFAEEHGARAAPTPAEAAQAAGTAISMVPDTPEVEAVLLGEEGAAAGMADGDLCIDMSTIAPTATKAIGERLAERGIDFLDALSRVHGRRPRTPRSRSWWAGRPRPSNAPDPCSRRWASSWSRSARRATAKWPS